MKLKVKRRNDDKSGIPPENKTPCPNTIKRNLVKLEIHFFVCTSNVAEAPTKLTPLMQTFLLNIRSIRGDFDDLICYFVSTDNCYSVIVLTEAWQDNDLLY